MVAARATVARTAVVPRCGGLDTISAVDIAWTGGDPYDTNVVAPAANGCCRPLIQTRPGRLKTSVCNQCMRPGSYK